MIIKQKTTSRLGVIALLFLITVISGACSKDDEGNGSGFGEASFMVSGEVEGAFSGMAEFIHTTTAHSDTWGISINDSGPRTFSFNISNTVVAGTTGRPSPGTYSIGNITSADYHADFLHFSDGSFSDTREYSTMFMSDDDGTLTITSSNDDTVKGHFEFTAHRADDDLDIVGTVQIAGEFTANKR